jgi:hypothetical protein
MTKYYKEKQQMTNLQSAQQRPIDIDQLIAIAQSEYPTAGIRITGRARTVRRQAELMAQRIRASRDEYLNTYRSSPHIMEMDRWYTSNAHANLEETTNEFERIITGAVSRGAIVSNHLSNTARDISWPTGNPEQLNAIETRIRALGASVIREPNAAGGSHWHVDW